MRIAYLHAIRGCPELFSFCVLVVHAKRIAVSVAVVSVMTVVTAFLLFQQKKTQEKPKKMLGTA